MKKKLLFSLLSMALLPPQSQGGLLKITSKKIIFKEDLQQVADKEVEKLINLKRSHKELFEETIKNNYSITSFVQDIFPNSQYNENLEKQKDNLEKTEYLLFLWQAFSETLPKDHENSIDFVSIVCNEYSLEYTNYALEQESLNKILKKMAEENQEENKFYDCSLEFLSQKLTKYKEIICPETPISFHQDFLLYALSLMIEKKILKTHMSSQKMILRAVFQETLKHHVLSNTKSSLGEFLKFSDIFDILLYARQKVNQFDDETELSLEEERTISKLLEEKFALYRYKKLKESEREAEKNKDIFLKDQESLEKDLLSLRDDGIDNEEEKEKINQKIESIFQNENILDVLKIIGIQVFLESISLKKGREKYANVDGIINFIEKKIIKLSDKYETAFHEGAHSFIALQHGVGVRFVTCISDEEDASGQVSRDFSDNALVDMLIGVAGILGNFIITGKLNKIDKISASHDFKKVIKLSKTMIYFKDLTLSDKEKEKIENYSRTGLDIFAQSDLGKFSLEDFFDLSKIDNRTNAQSDLEKFSLEDFFNPSKIDDEKNFRCNIIAACLVEVYDLLKNSYNNSLGEKKFSFLSEAIFEQGVMTIKNVNTIFALDSKNFFNYNDLLEEDSSEEEEPYSLKEFLDHCDNNLENLNEKEKENFIHYYENQKKIQRIHKDRIIYVPEHIINNIFKKQKRQFLLFKDPSYLSF